MAIKVLILRRGGSEHFGELKPLMKSIRSLALSQAGYVSGETYVNYEDPNEYLVISTWASIEQWNEWLNHPERVAMQNRIDSLLGQKTAYQIFQHA